MYNYSNYGAGNQYQYNPYYTIPQQPKVQPNEPYINQQPQMQPTYKQSMLQGKSVDSIDVVKAMDIPLDR